VRLLPSQGILCPIEVLTVCCNSIVFFLVSSHIISCNCYLFHKESVRILEMYPKYYSACIESPVRIYHQFWHFHILCYMLTNVSSLKKKCKYTEVKKRVRWQMESRNAVAWNVSPSCLVDRMPTF
jgi:hypothetical protein